MIRDIAPGSDARICTGWVTVIRHGESGTSVRPVAKVTRTVTSNRTGETKTFEAPQPVYVISSASPIYETR